MAENFILQLSLEWLGSYHDPAATGLCTHSTGADTDDKTGLHTAQGEALPVLSESNILDFDFGGFATPLI